MDLDDNAMKRIRPFAYITSILLLLLLGVTAMSASPSDHIVHLPIVSSQEPAPEPSTEGEFRGLWVTRFDWTSYGQAADPARIDQIVADAAYAGFNTIFFQVRGTADAYYQPGPEPWAQRISGSALGQPPPDNRWEPHGDPLAYFIYKAHEQGMQLHAYINVYPVWDDCVNAPPDVTPTHFYHLLNAQHGTTGGESNGMQWYAGDGVACGTYQRATPASSFADTHYLEVAQYLASNYDIDGIHLDHIRYGGGSTSCDPVSEAASGVPCFTSPPAGYDSYAAWQRAQVNGTVWKFYQQILQNNPEIALSAAVWPIYYDYWNWGINTGYGYYYQDSKAWIQGGYIDLLLPMIYGSSFWNQNVWETLVTDFQAGSSGRYVVPGIGANFDDFSEIETRINMGRQIGTPGHAIFSYGQLKARQYFDDLKNGPYAEPAAPPDITWR